MQITKENKGVRLMFDRCVKCSFVILLVCLCYPSEHHDRFLRDFLVLGMNSDHVKKECFKEGNALTFSKAREMAKADESAEKQLQLMNPVVSEVHPVNSTMKTQFQSDQLNPVAGGSRQNPKGNKSGKTQLCRNCGWALTLVNSAQQEMRHVITAKRWDTLPRYAFQNLKRRMCMRLKLLVRTMPYLSQGLPNH